MLSIFDGLSSYMLLILYQITYWTVLLLRKTHCNQRMNERRTYDHDLTVLDSAQHMNKR